MSSKFFTNTYGNTLENRLKDILKHYKVSYLEFLIGYLRISGFAKIAPFLENVSKSRILVGINIDTIIAEAQIKGKKANLLDNFNLIDQFKDEQNSVLKNSEYAKEVDDSVDILIDMISSKKLELRISRDKNIHAKIYILREEAIEKHDGTIDYRGSVITGSSNLSKNGLENNYEFNVELRDSDDIEFALNEFEKLWSTSVEITKDDIDNIKNSSYLKEITPFELYIKFLIEHFGEDRINFDESVADDLPKGFKKLAYQIDAVNEGLAKLKKHGGFFLSDVVGLGKTVTATMIIRRLQSVTKGHILIIAPPSIRKEWEETFNKFNISRQHKFYSYAELYKLKDTTNYETIIIDESHKFKSFATTRYKELERICKEDTKYKKKIILISATPLNNKPNDLANQLYLFQNKRQSSIDSFPNLETFFAQIDKEYREILSNDPIDNIKLKNISFKIRDNIIREVMVRRTRTDIENIPRYRDDIKSQGLAIPNINEVQELEYYLDDDLTKLFYETIDVLISKLNYARYKALANLSREAQLHFGDVQEGFFKTSSENLAKIMQFMLIKRLESSFHAFKTTLKKQKENIQKFIDMFENDVIYIPNSKLNFFEMLEDSDDEDALIEKLLEEEKIVSLSKKDFRDGYYDLLKSDFQLINTLCEKWELIDRDPKLDKFKEILARNKNDKIVVFTESKQTALYLNEKLENDKVLVVHGENRDKLKETIRENFDANYDNQKDDYNVIISTDTLSEGVNMHRSNIIYNYDIPWNSTRLMQRIGRINRIGTKHEEIFIYNFKPTAQSESLIELSKKAYIKLQTFHHSLGEDSKIYSKAEEIGTASLFDESIESEIDEELPFLEEIRAFKEANPKTFQEIKTLPKKLRVQRVAKNDKQSFVFIKNNNSKNYYKVANDKVEAINFVDMAKNLTANMDEKPKLPLQEIHYTHVELARKYFNNELNEIAGKTQTDNIKVDNKIDKQAITILKSWYQKDFILSDVYELFVDTIKIGKILNLSKEVIKISKNSNSSEIADKLVKLSEKYSLVQKTDKEQYAKKEIDIILSESFV